jgi:hypothetical protein
MGRITQRVSCAVLIIPSEHDLTVAAVRGVPLTFPKLCELVCKCHIT